MLLCTGIQDLLQLQFTASMFSCQNLNVRQRTGTPVRYFSIFLFVKELQYSLLNPTINFWGLVCDYSTPWKISQLFTALLLHSKYVVNRIWLPKRLIIIMLDALFWILSFNWGFSPERWKILIPGGLKKTRTKCLDQSVHLEKVENNYSRSI